MSLSGTIQAFLDHAWLQQFDWALIDSKQLILLAVTPLFFLAMLLEWLYLRRQGRTQSYTRAQLLTNINLGGSYQVFELIIHAAILMAAMQWFYAHRIFNVTLSAWTLLPLFVLQEFCYYCFHRASHRVRWFWCAHVVHHSEEGYNLSTATRQSMLYALTGYWLFFMPLVLLGLTPHQAMALYAANLFYQFFVHTQTINKLPAWFEYIFVTPSGHRVHHGRNPQYLDKNYGGVLIIFDRLFGTYAPEQEAVDYGIVNPIHSHNIWTLNTHEFSAMLRDMRHSGSLWQRLQHLWRPPEWRRS